MGSDYDHEASFASSTTYDWVAPAEAEDENVQAVNRINPFIDRRMRRAVDAELAARGLQRVEEGPVDLLVSVDVLDAGRVGEIPRGARARRDAGCSSAWGSASTPVGTAPGDGDTRSPGDIPTAGDTRAGGYGYGSRYGWGYGGRSIVGASLGYGTPYFGYPTTVGVGVASYGGWGGRNLELPPGTFIIDVLDGESGDLLWRGWAEGALLYTNDVEDLPEFIASTVHRIMEDLPVDGV